jgi:hypothetical protein
MKVVGNYVYLFVNGRLLIGDISNPSNPVLLSEIDNLGADPYGICEFGGIDVSGNYVYAACTWLLLRVVDVSNPEKPKLLGSVSTKTGAMGAVNVFVAGNYAYVAVIGKYSGIYVFDVSNPESPELKGRLDVIDGDADGADVYVSTNGYIYVVDGENLKIIKLVE